MAVSVANLMPTGFDNADLSTYTTASVAITKPSVFMMWATGMSTITATPSITVPSGVTATRIVQGSRVQMQMDVWWLTGAGTGTIEVTYTSAAATGAMWQLDEFTDAATTTPTNVLGTNAAIGSNLTGTLPGTPAASSGVWMSTGITASAEYGAPTGTVETADHLAVSSPGRSTICFFDAPAPAGATYTPTTGNGNPAVMCIVEVAQAAGGGTAPTFTAETPPAVAGLHQTYAGYTFTASGDATITFAVQTGALPPGITLSSGGVLSGTARTPGTYTFTVRATNSTGTDDTGSIVITVPAEGWGIIAT